MRLAFCLTSSPTSIAKVDSVLNGFVIIFLSFMICTKVRIHSCLIARLGNGTMVGLHHNRKHLLRRGGAVSPSVKMVPECLCVMVNCKHFRPIV